VSIRISKSKFVAGCQCLKHLYWQVHEPELAPRCSEGGVPEGDEVNAYFNVEE
jgi:hypothetical protein